MKDLKMQTKLGIGFIIIDLLVLVGVYMGYSTAKKLLTVDDPEGYVENYKIFTIVLFLVCVGVTTAISIMVIKGIANGIAQISAAGRQIAMGKVDVRLEKKSDDEFGQLIDEYQTVVDNIRYQASIAEQVAEGNLAVDVIPKSGDDVLGQSLKKLVSRNLHAMTNISDAAYQVMTSSSQVASASESLAQGSTEQASAIEQITASIGDIAEKTKKNAAQASTAEELMVQALADVKQGNAQMHDMMNAMEDINKSSESISKIIKVIDDIAFQTNILALNAAVEAARAGEAGKGFAVVAEEVRNLAAKSAAAAAETAELIEDSIHKVETGSKIADDTAKALDTITDRVTQSEAIVTEIAEASNYQATAIAQIDQAVSQVSQVVQTNSATSEECAAASIELSSQANRMRDLISVYNLGNNNSMSMSSSYSDNKWKNNANRNEQIISLGDGFGKY